MQYIDGAQIALYAFWIFFFGLVIYLRRRTGARATPQVAPGPARGLPARARQEGVDHAPRAGRTGGRCRARAR
jgi:hypothetical protein